MERSMKASNAAVEPLDRQAYSVPEFARVHDVSRAHIYNLIKDGRGPRLMRLGRRTLVSAEAAAEWRRRMEEATTTVAA
jgi:predicted DNA-binding transcriptional regulator AlpA